MFTNAKILQKSTTNIVQWTDDDTMDSSLTLCIVSLWQNEELILLW